jgi:hypothetical protein
LIKKMAYFQKEICVSFNGATMRHYSYSQSFNLFSSTSYINWITNTQ